MKNLADSIVAWSHRDGVSSVLHGVHVAFWFWFPHLSGSSLVGIIAGMLAFSFYRQREAVDRIEHPDKRSDSAWDAWMPWLATVASIAGILTHGWV